MVDETATICSQHAELQLEIKPIISPHVQFKRLFSYKFVESPAKLAAFRVSEEQSTYKTSNEVLTGLKSNPLDGDKLAVHVTVIVYAVVIDESQLIVRAGIQRMMELCVGVLVQVVSIPAQTVGVLVTVDKSTD